MNPYQPYTPEWRVWNLAQLPGVKISDTLILEGAGWVPNDGTMLRTELILQYDNDYSRAHGPHWNCLDPKRNVHAIDCPRHPRYDG